MTDEEAVAIAARAEAATPGEWIVHEWTGEVLVYHQSGTQTTIAHYPATKADAAFIAHARADIPALLADRAALREIARAVAIVPDSAFNAVCPFCYGSDARHTADCPIDQARALLAGD